jgi:hypothetical protein
MDKKDLKKCLTEEEVLVLKEKCGIEFSTPTVTSDDLIVYVPGEIADRDKGEIRVEVKYSNIKNLLKR